MLKIDIELAKKQPEILFKSALDEGEIIITQNDEPLLKIQRFSAGKKRRKSGSAKGLISIAPDFDQPLEDFQEYI